MYPVRVLSVESVPLTSLKPYPQNPRRGDIASITESLRTHGQFRPIVVNRRTGHILAGNHTWLAAKRLRWTKIAVSWVDVDAEGERRIVLADNRTHELGGYDEAALLELLRDLGDLAGTGYDDFDVDQLEGLFEEGDLFESEPRPAREKNNTKISVGDYRMLVDNKCYDPWLDAVLAEHGPDPAEVIVHLRQSLGLTAGSAPAPPKPPRRGRVPVFAPVRIVVDGAEEVRLDSLAAFPGNPRQGDIGAIAGSLAKNGQYRPIVADRNTRHVLVGNHTAQAARMLGWQTIAVAWVDVDEQTAKRIVLIDNHTADQGGWDERALVSLLTEVDGFDGTGYTGDDVDELLRKVGEVDPVKDPNVGIKIGEYGWKVATDAYEAWATDLVADGAETSEQGCARIIELLDLPADGWVQAKGKTRDE